MKSSYIFEQILQLEADGISKDSETGFLKVENHIISPDLSREIYFMNPDNLQKSDVFNMASDFCEGIAAVGIKGKGCGYINTDFEFISEPIYDNVSCFCNGIAQVSLDNKNFFIDKTGNAIFDPEILSRRKYTDIEFFSEGLCRVSAMPATEKELVRRSRSSDLAGIWGYINQKGEETVKPRFVYAEDFLDSFAVAAKGKWVFDKENFDYIAKDVRWGVIDKNGNEVIPFEFSSIKRMLSDRSMFAVCTGEGRWGVADSHGSITFDPVFEAVADCCNGLVVFSNDREKSDCYNYELYGIYDLDKKEILFNSQFYKVSFEEDNLLKVAVFDKELDRTVEKIIDRSGKEIFKSPYTLIATFRQPYTVCVRENGEEAQGLTDKNGNIIFPLTKGIDITGIHYEQKRIVFNEDRKKYMCDFDGNRLTERTYDSINGFEDRFLTVTVREKGKNLQGIIDLDGNTVIEPVCDRVITLNGNRGFVTVRGKNAEYIKLI